MKNQGLIIGGGVAIVALGAFLWMRKKNQMAEEVISEEEKAKTDTGTGTTSGTGKLGSSQSPNSPIPRTDEASVKGSGQSLVKELQSASINNAEDLKKTALGLEMSVELLTSNQLFNVNKAIASLNSGERKILNYIALVNAPSRQTTEFKNALGSILGASAPSMIESVSSKILNSVNGTASLPTFQQCMDEARAKGIPSFRRVKYALDCMKGLTSFNGSYSFNASGFENDCEDFAFNGHTF